MHAARASGFVLAGLAVALSVAGCAGSGGGDSVSALTTRSGAFRPAARGEASRLLSQVVLPQGAQRLPAAPRGDGGLLRQAQSVPGASRLVDVWHVWRVHRTYSSTHSFVENHLPHGAQAQVTGGAVDGPGMPRSNGEFSYAMPIREGMDVVWLDFTLVSLPHGWTGIRADALVGRCPCVHH